ncbi:MAG: DUF4271 domain-containing protein [Bacteroidaceae bacterium]|nr:DUF4271 domain-containing protein [Bacteroidaceae bacterium]
MEQAIPYLLSNDDWITGILLVCFLITSYVLSHGRTLLFQSMRKLFSTHEINHIFHKKTVVDTYCLLLLNLQTCLLVSILLLNILSEDETLTPSVALSLLGCYSLIMLLYLLGKRIVYRFVNWTFFDRVKNSLWIDSYFFIIAIGGMLLLPITLLIVYCDFPYYLSVLLPAILLFLMNLYFIYRCFSIFFSQLHGLCYLFLYFCTLEVLPFLLVWKVVGMVNDIFI